MRTTRRRGRFRQKSEDFPGGVPSLRSLAVLAGEAKATDDKTVKNLLKSAECTQDTGVKWMAYEYLGRLALKQVLEPDPFAPPIDAEVAKGELPVGRIGNSGCEFGLWMRELVQGTYVSGRIGSGKTTFIRRLLVQLLTLCRYVATSARFLVFDIKRDYVDLPVRFPEVVGFRLPGPGFRWNPLEPPIRDVGVWAGIFSAAFANSVGFHGGMSTEYLLNEYLERLYAKYDVENGVYPCLLDLRDFLGWVRAKEKIDRWTERYRSFERIKNRVEGLCRSLGSTINCSRGYPLSELLGRHVVLDMARLKKDAQSFFTEMFLTQAIQYRMEREERGGELRTLAVFDEAKRLMPRFREEGQHAVSNMSDSIAQGREFGIGFIAAECHPRLLGDSIKSSAFARVCFGQTSGKDVEDSGKALGLSDQDQVPALYMLDRGEAVVRLSERIDRPFVLRVSK
jgi:DNA helicase HerA-like ATPase